MNEMYRRWYKYIRDDINNKAIKVETKVKIKIEVWDRQWPKDLLHLIGELELDK